MQEVLMRAMLFRVFLSILALQASAAVAAETPEQAVQAYMAALKAEGMIAAPRYVHPDELVRFKEMLMPLVRREASGGKREFTDAVFGSNTPIEEIEKISGVEFMTALMKLVGDKLGAIEFTSVDTLGSVQEREVVHVVTRVGVSGPQGLKMRQMEVVSVKSLGGEWKLMLSGELEGMAAAISAQ
jgi:hypothetical protein